MACFEFFLPTKVHLIGIDKDGLNNFRDDLSTAVIAQTFEGFNDLCTKAHDMELHLSKRRRSRNIEKFEASTIAVVEANKKTAIIVGAKKPKDAKKISMKERIEKKYSFTDDLVEDLFKDFLEQKLITLLDVKRPYEVGKMNDPKYFAYH